MCDSSCLMGFSRVILGTDIKVLGYLAAREAISSLMGLQKMTCIFELHLLVSRVPLSQNWDETNRFTTDVCSFIACETL